VTTNHAREHPVVAEMVEPPRLAVALPRGIHQGQVARSAEALGVAALTGEKTLLESDGDVLGKADADEAAGGDRVAVTNQPHRFVGGDDLAGIRSTQRRGHGVGG